MSDRGACIHNTRLIFEEPNTNMKLEHIHFIREILATDKRGRKIPTMQISYAKATDLNPVFQNVPRKFQNEMRILYSDLGGGRLDKWSVGLTLIIPNWNME
jgi:hypothetical protein